MQIKQVAQHATDLVRAARFYQELFETPPAATFDPPGLVFFILRDVRLLLDQAVPSALHYFQVQDLPQVIARLRDAGVTVISKPHVIFTHDTDTLGPAGAEEWQAFVEDSEGNQVGLIELRTLPGGTRHWIGLAIARPRGAGRRTGGLGWCHCDVQVRPIGTVSSRCSRPSGGVTRRVTHEGPGTTIPPGNPTVFGPHPPTSTVRRAPVTIASPVRLALPHSLQVV